MVVIDWNRWLQSTGAGSRAEKALTAVIQEAYAVASFPNEAVIVRLVGALLLEQNDEWAASGAAT